MDDAELRRERRKQKRLEALGTNNPVCPLCKETDWRCLEEHHVAGRKRDDFTVQICANCHRKVTDDQVDHPSSNLAADPLLDRIGHFLLGLADMLALLVKQLKRFGGELIERAKTRPVLEGGS